MSRSRTNVDAFELRPGRKLAGKYEVLSRVGSGLEGEVYLVREPSTGIERAAKLFFPHRNINDRTARFYARKLHRLRHCPLVIQYHAWETVVVGGVRTTCLVSEFVEGELLSEFLLRQPGKRLVAFQALHLLYALARGIEPIHQLGEYHGDLHSENIIVERFGLGFHLKLLDFFDWKGRRREGIQDDVIDLVRLFHEALGGRSHYSRQAPEVKSICCGLRKTLILKKFRTAGQLRIHLDNMSWD